LAETGNLGANAIVGGSTGIATGAAAVAWFLAQQLGEHFVQGSALGKAMTVAAVGTGNVVVAPQCLADAHGNRFLPDIEMRESRHLGAEIELIDLLFKQADLQHLPVEAQ